jgi:hypothetical protein
MNSAIAMLQLVASWPFAFSRAFFLKLHANPVRLFVLMLNINDYVEGEEGVEDRTKQGKA